MGTLIVLGVIVLSVFLGIVIISLLSMAQKREQIYERLHLGEERATLENACSWPATETLSPTSNGEARLQRDLSASVAAALTTPEPKVGVLPDVSTQETTRGK
jgi:hypothetical protein